MMILKEVISECIKCTINFSTEFGEAKAFWDGSTPELDKEYFVEFEITNILTWGINIKKADDDKYAIGMNDTDIFIIGCLESSEDDGYSVIRLGDSIISLETEGTPFPTGTFVKLEVNNATLYNVNY